MTHVSYTKSFKDLALETVLNFEEISRCVKHLIYWKQGKIIYPIDVNKIYRICDNADISVDTSRKFKRFMIKNHIRSQWSFEKYVKLFSETQEYKDKVKHFVYMATTDLYQIIAYLMRTNVIEEHFYHYYLLFPLRKELDEQHTSLEKRKIKAVVVKYRSRSIDRPVLVMNESTPKAEGIKRESSSPQPVRSNALK